MLSRAVFVAASLAFGIAASDDYKFCLTVNRVAAADKLKDYTNRQIENGLCMTSKEVVDAIRKNDSVKQNICTEATQHMMIEFKRRFPSRNAKEVVGRC